MAAVKNIDATRRTHVCARTYKGVELVNISDIRYLKADQKYVSVLHVKGEVIIDEPQRELENEFPDLSPGFDAMLSCRPTLSLALKRCSRLNQIAYARRG